MFHALLVIHSSRSSEQNYFSIPDNLKTPPDTATGEGENPINQANGTTVTEERGGESSGTAGSQVCELWTLTASTNKIAKFYPSRPNLWHVDPYTLEYLYYIMRTSQPLGHVSWVSNIEVSKSECKLLIKWFDCQRYFAYDWPCLYCFRASLTDTKIVQVRKVQRVTLINPSLEISLDDWLFQKWMHSQVCAIVIYH